MEKAKKALKVRYIPNNISILEQMFLSKFIYIICRSRSRSKHLSMQLQDLWMHQVAKVVN